MYSNIGQNYGKRLRIKCRRCDRKNFKKGREMKRKVDKKGISGTKNSTFNQNILQKLNLL